MNITLCYITSRPDNRIQWFFDSLMPQIESHDKVQLIVVDLHAKTRDTSKWPNGVELIEPKPTVWQGQFRVTSQDWWAVSNSRNTGLCKATEDYIVWVDDRCVLMPGWLEAVKLAKLSNYAVCGNYEKRTGMVVENGTIVHGGIVTGKDGRDTGRNVVQNCFGQFWGGTYGCPLEWALQLNGFEELVDGLGAEDYIFGNMLLNNGFESKWNPKLKIVEDRTPGEIGPDMRKTDKGVSPKDKSHAALDRFGNLKRTQHPWDLRAIRETVLAGGPFPNTDTFPRHDWFDGEAIALMK